MNGHQIILNDFLRLLEAEKITSILDAGSGKTSLNTIIEHFPNAFVDAVVYPGDIRKLNSISEIKALHENITVIEKDICSEIIDKEYDLITAHLLLGEAVKFGNSFDDLLKRTTEMKYKYLIIIDYLEDPSVNENTVRKICGENDLTILYRSYFTNEQPQVWKDFIGVHNFGYLIKKI